MEELKIIDENHITKIKIRTILLDDKLRQIKEEGREKELIAYIKKELEHMVFNELREFITFSETKLEDHTEFVAEIEIIDKPKKQTNNESRNN